MSRLLVVGDSHARALALGAAALGYETLSFATSAAAWRDGIVQLTPQAALTSERFRARQKIEGFARELGCATPLLSGLPVVASIGFHSAQFLTEMRLARLGLTTVPSRSAKTTLSTAFLADWLAEARSSALEGLATIAAQAPLAVVAPPLFAPNPLLQALNAALSKLIQARGLPLYDPNTALADSAGQLPAHFAHSDGKHGNATFGAAVLEDIISRNLIPKPSAPRA